MNAAVLIGGKSGEREVSLSTGRMIIEALDRTKYDVFPVDPAYLDKSLKPITIELPASGKKLENVMPLNVLFDEDSKPDVAFIALHGRFGEDGTIQGMLELLDIPYVGSGVLASSLAINKIMTRKVLIREGIPMPGGINVKKGAEMENIVSCVLNSFGFPCVVKPNREGSTIGLSIVHGQDEMPEAVKKAFECDEDVLIEEYIKGTEITVPVIGNDEIETLPVVEIVPASGFYDYYSKYTEGATEEIVPARIPEPIYKRAQRIALACHRILGCRGMSRTDMIVKGRGIITLEVNTIPGMTPTSLLPRSAQAAGISFPELLDRLIGYAFEGRRTGGET